MSRKPITIKIRSGAELIQAAHDHNARVAAWYAKKPLLGKAPQNLDCSPLPLFSDAHTQKELF